jgi:flavin reductase (DIM6/NTAB) family NADH-FMN oxidoreductase RutF
MSGQNIVFGWLPCPVVFVSTANGDKRDIMTATAMFVSEKEPLVLISVASNHLTCQLIEESGEFVIAIASSEQGQLADQLASMRGDTVDKFDHLSIPWLVTQEGKPSVPEGCAAWMICTVESTQDVKGYRIFTGRIIEQQDLRRAPMVWHNNGYYSLQSV